MAKVDIREALASTIDNSKDMAAHATKVSAFMRKAPIVAGMVIGGAALLDWGMDTAADNAAKRDAKRMRKQEKENSSKTDETKEIAYSSMKEFEGYVQSLWDERNQHSNRWGGKLY